MLLADSLQIKNLTFVFVKVRVQNSNLIKLGRLHSDLDYLALTVSLSLAIDFNEYAGYVVALSMTVVDFSWACFIHFALGMTQQTWDS